MFYRKLPTLAVIMSYSTSKTMQLAIFNNFLNDTWRKYFGEKMHYFPTQNSVASLRLIMHSHIARLKLARDEIAAASPFTRCFLDFLFVYLLEQGFGDISAQKSKHASHLVYFYQRNNSVTLKTTSKDFNLLYLWVPILSCSTS